eukprot:14375696-Alexandrium_andersonii.AAC.1
MPHGAKHPTTEHLAPTPSGEAIAARCCRRSWQVAAQACARTFFQTAPASCLLYTSPSPRD